MDAVGAPLFPWQALIVHDAFGVREDGLWSAFEVVALLSRQNGKGRVTEAIELASMYLLKTPIITHSAHQFKTCSAAFQRTIDIINGNDWTASRLARNGVSRSKGDESITLSSAAGGARLQYLARSNGSGRGLTGWRTVLDEAWALTTAQYAAQTPGLATVDNPQIIYTSTPPDEDIGPMPTDAMLPSVRARGLANHPGGRTALYEWSPPRRFDRTDVEVWRQANPSLGLMITPEFLRMQLLAFGDAGRPEKFDTEHLGVWPDDENQQWLVISEEDWAMAQDLDSRTVDPRAFALEINMERTRGCIGVAGRRADGLRHIEIAAEQAGTAWMVPWMIERNRKWNPCAVVVDAGSPTASLIPDLEAAGIEVFQPTTRGYAAACGAVRDAISGNVKAGEGYRERLTAARDLRHVGQGDLTAAVAAARTRDLAGGQVWERDATGYRLSAVSLALYGHAVKAPDWTGNYDPVANIW